MAGKTSPTKEKIPPYDIEAEEAVIGSLLIDGTAIGKIADTLSPQDIYNEKNRWIYDVCLYLYQSNEAINQITVAHELNNKGKLDNSGGAAYLSYLISVCPTSLDIEHYSEIVHRLAIMRNLITVGNQIASIGYDGGDNVGDAIDKARALLDDIKPAKSRYLDLSGLRIIKSNPPHYIVNVNGDDMNLNLGELQSWGRFRTKVLSERDFIPIKPKNWELTINRLLSQAAKFEAPVDTSAEAEIKLSIKRWFEQRSEGSEYSDIQSGCYAVVPYRGNETAWEQKEYWAFQPTPLLRWLKRDLGKTVKRDELWAMALGWGIIKHQWRIGKGQSGIPIRLWALPPQFAESVEFAIEEREEQTQFEMDNSLPDF